MTLEPLSVRECAVITALGRGATYRVIANDLHIQMGTVRQYIERAYRKLGVNDKASAVLAHQSVHGVCAKG